MPESVYIHIPFCKKKCKYCSFVSFPREEIITGYVYSLLKEITENYQGEKLNTLYFGGGTPSLLPVDLITKIVKKFNFHPEAEITFEANPDDLTLPYIENLKKLGINRLSIGSQTFDDNILELIGRRHNSAQIETAVKLAKQAGFENISIDLIYGLPTQNIEKLKIDMEKAVELDVQHISTYGLKIEENTAFGKNPPKELPDDDTQADMYELIHGFLENNSFYQYEISNFAKKGYESRHNLNYWNNDEYYGFGVSAHGYVDGIRYSNFTTLEKYMENPTLHEFGKFLTQKEKLEEEIFLGFRKTEGVNINKINEHFDIDFEKKYKDILTKYSDYFIKTNEGYAFNLKGMLVSNIILAEFLGD